MSPYYFGDFLAIESLPPQPSRCCHRAATARAVCRRRSTAAKLPPTLRCRAVALLPLPCHRQAAADVRFRSAADVRFRAAANVRFCAAATAAATALLPPRCRRSCRRPRAVALPPLALPPLPPLLPPPRRSLLVGCCVVGAF